MNPANGLPQWLAELGAQVTRLSLAVELQGVNTRLHSINLERQSANIDALTQKVASLADTISLQQTLMADVILALGELVAISQEHRRRLDLLDGN